jgi:predicted enzyme related to lactoylglutathione lyase
LSRPSIDTIMPNYRHRATGAQVKQCDSAPAPGALPDSAQFADSGHNPATHFVMVVTRHQPRLILQEDAVKIKLAKVYVNDQEKALNFYTDVLGFQKKDDFSNEGYRWLTVVSPEDPDGAQLLLELNANPAAKAYQEATYEAGQPAAILHSEDVQADYDRMTALGANFTMPPTDVTYAVIATVDDTCGNLLQLTQLARW